MAKVKKEWRPDGYIKSALRKIWRWSPQRRECLKNGRCLFCGKRRKIFADHISPVIAPSDGFTTWDNYINRLFNGELQPLCKDCHKVKSKEENRQRRETRKRLKNAKSA